MPKQRVTTRQRQQVIERAKGCCEYCCSQAKFATQAFTVEHIIPRYLKGETVLANLALSCFGCNGHKSIKVENIDPQTKLTSPLFHPRRQKWMDHFRWDETYTFIVALTATGRVTIETLHLNRPELVNLRRVLRAVGEHPPR